MRTQKRNRRSLALSLLIALFSGFLGATPAHAAYTDYRISAGTGNTIVAGQPFVLSITITCDTAMSLNSSPYYPSMYYLVNSNPRLNNYISAPPTLSNGNKTATWNVPLTAPTVGTYNMYAYARSTVCFGDNYNFTNTPNTALTVVSGPIVSAMDPAADSTGILTNAPLSITYHESVTTLAGNFYLRKFSDDTIVSTFDVSSLSHSGSVLSFGSLSGLDPGTEYYLTADAGVVESTANGNDSAALTKASNLAFTTSIVDLSSPTVLSTTPVQNSFNQPLPSSLTLQFSENVTSSGSGSLEIRESDSDSLVSAISISQAAVSGSLVTFSIPVSLSYSTSYYVLIPAGSFVDTSPNSNQFAGFLSGVDFGFSTEPAPDLTAPLPTGASTDTVGRQISIVFDEALSSSGTVPTSSFQIFVNGNARTASSLAIASSTLALTLHGQAVTSSDTISISYSDPTAGNDSNVLQDFAGNDVSSFSRSVTNLSVWDGSQAYVLSVQGVSPNGSYREGDSVALKLVFNEAVSVSGQPSILLETGSTDQLAQYESGSGTSELVFRFTVSNIATTEDLNYSSTTSLVLNGGSIQNLSGDFANTALPGLDSSQSLKALAEIRLDNSQPVATLSPAASPVTSNNPTFQLIADEALDCSTLSTSPGVDFDFGGFTSIQSISAISNGCQIAIVTSVPSGTSALFSISGAASFSVGDLAGNTLTTISGVATVSVQIPAPAPAPAPAPLPTVTPSYSDWRISVGATNQVNPGEVFELQISITCNQEMALTGSPYYPSMYYMVRTSPWLNGYLSDRPVLSSDRKTATWTVQLEAPSSAGSFEMYAYARGQVCFGDSFNFAYSSRATLRIETGMTGATTSPSVSQTASPAVTAGYTDWSLASTPSQVVERGSQLRLSVSITCNVSMRLDGAPYYPSMYYFLNSSPRVNGVFGRPVLSSDGKTATWEVSVAAPMTPGRYVFQAYGRDNPAGPTCFGSSQRFTYSGGKIVEVGDIQESTQSATSSPVAGYSSWRLSATGSQGMVEGSEISLNVSLTCNVRMSTNSAPYYPSMYYLVSSPDRINGVFSRPTISADGLTARWTVKVPAPESGTYNFSAYGRDNPSGGTCFGDSFNFAYSGNLPLVIGQEVVEEVTVSPEATPSPTAEPTVSPAPSAEPSPSPSATAAASPSPAQSPTPSATAAEPQTSATPVAPLRIVTPALPGSIQFGNNVFEISTAFVVSIIDSLRDSQELVGDEIVRVRLGESDWIETSIDEIELGTDPLVFQGQASEDTTLELEVISADGAQVLGVASYELNTSGEQVAVTMTESDSEQIPWQLTVLLTFAIFGIVIAAMSIRRRLNKK